MAGETQDKRNSPVWLQSETSQQLSLFLKQFGRKEEIRAKREAAEKVAGIKYWWQQKEGVWRSGEWRGARCVLGGGGTVLFVIHYPTRLAEHFSLRCSYCLPELEQSQSQLAALLCSKYLYLLSVSSIILGVKLIHFSGCDIFMHLPTSRD